MRLRSPPLALLALLLLGLVLAALTTLSRPGSGPHGAAAAAPTRESASAAREAGPDLVEPRQVEAPTVVEQPVLERRLVFRSSADGTPVAGVQLYSQGRIVAGPSGADGALVVPEALRAWGLDAWAPGWAPAQLPARPPLPEELLLAPATAGVQVWVRGSDPGLRIARTRLVPAGAPTRQDEPWTPRLRSQGPLATGASQLPPGPYHIYVWTVNDERQAPRALPRQEVELLAGQTLQVELDADAPRRDEPDG